jgi:hypothetical protein
VYAEVTPFSALFAAAAVSTVEAPVQTLFAAVTDGLCKSNAKQQQRQQQQQQTQHSPSQQQRLHSCDTHNDGYPTDPIQKIDIIISSQAKPERGQGGVSMLAD